MREAISLIGEGFFMLKINLEVKLNVSTFDFMIQNETYLTTKEAGALLKVSRATLNRWRKDKKIKAKKFCGVVRYKLSDIQKAMK